MGFEPVRLIFGAPYAYLRIISAFLSLPRCLIPIGSFGGERVGSFGGDVYLGRDIFLGGDFVLGSHGLRI